ncbi:MAG: outer membrane protein assembly factor BamE [Pseudomonadota bacterium]
MSRLIILIITIFILTSLSACSTKLGRLFTVYKMDVQQGNAVEPEKVRQLEIGMSKSQVEYLLGTPLIADIFHPERWDYIYYLIPDYGERERRHVAVFFEGSVVSKIEEDDIPPPEVAALEDETEINYEDKQDQLEEEIQIDATSEDLEELQKEEGL